MRPNADSVDQLDQATMTLIEALRARMTAMTDDERFEVKKRVLEGYCEDCLSRHLPCYCTNDD